MCLIGVKETYVQEKKKWQKTFWVKFALPYPALNGKGGVGWDDGIV